MGIKRKIEENGLETDKKSKVDDAFPIETFVRNLKDPESSFLGESNSTPSCAYDSPLASRLALSEFNEYVRRTSSPDQLMETLLQALKSNLDDVVAMISEEKRKSSEVRS